MKLKTFLLRTGEFLLGGAILAAAVLFYVKTGTERTIMPVKLGIRMP